MYVCARKEDKSDANWVRDADDDVGDVVDDDDESSAFASITLPLFGFHLASLHPLISYVTSLSDSEPSERIERFKVVTKLENIVR